MNAELEVGTVLTPSRPSNRAWRRGLVVASIGVAGLVVGLGASELADGTSDTAPPAAVVEADVAPSAPVTAGRTGVSGMSPDAAARWLETQRSTDRPDMSEKFGTRW